MGNGSIQYDRALIIRGNLDTELDMHRVKMVWAHKENAMDTSNNVCGLCEARREE